MDHFGIGAAVKGAVEVYFHSARRTGRTSSLVHSLKTGDRVVFFKQAEADRVKALCKELGKDVDCIVAPISNTREALRQIGTPEGRLLFDHSWIEEAYKDAVKQRYESIDYMQREFGGFGEAHLETRRRAAEMAKWRI